MLYVCSQLSALVPPVGKHDLDIKSAPPVHYSHCCLDYINLLSHIRLLRLSSYNHSADDDLITLCFITMSNITDIKHV